jgi:hypothetical protein
MLSFDLQHFSQKSQIVMHGQQARDANKRQTMIPPSTEERCAQQAIC